MKLKTSAARSGLTRERQSSSYDTYAPLSFPYHALSCIFDGSSFMTRLRSPSRPLFPSSSAPPPCARRRRSGSPAPPCPTPRAHPALRAPTPPRVTRLSQSAVALTIRQSPAHVLARISPKTTASPPTTSPGAAAPVLFFTLLPSPAPTVAGTSAPARAV